MGPWGIGVSYLGPKCVVQCHQCIILSISSRTRRLSEATQTQPTTTVCNHMPPAYSAYGDVDGAGTNGDIAYANPVYDGLPEKINNVFENVEVDLGHDSEGNPVDKVPLHQVWSSELHSKHAAIGQNCVGIVPMLVIMLCITGPLWWKPPLDSYHKGPVMPEMYTCHVMTFPH